MIEKIIIAGAGGQGVMLLGKVLATAAMKEGRQVTWLPSYGAEVRGGTAHCMVIISDEEIASPYIALADSLIVMNGPSLDKFKGRLKKKGLLIINSSLAPADPAVNEYSLRYPFTPHSKKPRVSTWGAGFTDIALKLGNIRIANMVALGCFVTHKNVVKLKSVVEAISDIAPEGKRNLIEINTKALREGFRLDNKQFNHLTV